MADEGLAPTLLVAMPQMLDPNFNRAVVLLCKYGEEGALGFILNRPVEATTTDILEDAPDTDHDSSVSVWEGGPVNRESGWLLCRRAPADGACLQVSDGLYMSSSEQYLYDILEHAPEECSEDRTRLLLGYAGWAPGQLDGELVQSAWLTAPLEIDFVFETPPEELWERVIRRIGVDPTAIAPAPGLH